MGPRLRGGDEGGYSGEPIMGYYPPMLHQSLTDTAQAIAGLLEQDHEFISAQP